MALRSIIFFFLISLFSTNAMAAENFSINHETKLSDLKGKVVYIDFWASWCKPCRASFPFMNDMHAKYQAEGLEIIAVNLDENKENAEAFLERLPANFTVVFDPDGNIAQQYELVGMPSSYLVDRDGNLRASHQGFFTAQLPAYENEIKQLLAE